MKWVLYCMGIVFNFCTRLYRISMKVFLTEEVRKINPGIKFVGYSTVLKNAPNIHIGKGTYINGGELYAALSSSIFIGDNCMISYGVIIRTDMHNHDHIDIPMINQGVSVSDIIIEDDVWVGHGAYIMPGVTVHRGAVVGARAVVTKDVPEYAVVVGVPAKIVNYRTCLNMKS